MSAPLDVVTLTQGLIRCPSVTPEEGGALALLEAVLGEQGFACQRLPFSEPGTEAVDNLYARVGSSGRNFCFAGHTDVVPPGPLEAWTSDPFAAEIRDDILYGRGAVDMKGAIAAFVAALSAFLGERGPDFGGSISLLITGDEEADAINGTRKVLGWLKERGEILDACLVGEPTSDQALGDTIKIGRRGSLNGRLTVRGIQGHTAYPHLADNPVHHLVRMLHAITGEALDEGSEHFPATSLQVTTVDVGNATSNVIPGEATAAFNVRFNDCHDSASVQDWLCARLDSVGQPYELTIRVSGESFLCAPGPWSSILSEASQAVTRQAPVLGTTGGTSDARFIKDHAPVAELGLINETAHKVDECVSLADLRALTAIYRGALDRYFPL